MSKGQNIIIIIIIIITIINFIRSLSVLALLSANWGHIASSVYLLYAVATE